MHFDSKACEDLELAAGTSLFLALEQHCKSMQWLSHHKRLYVQVIQHIAAEIEPIGSGISFEEFENMIVSLPEFASSFNIIF